MSLRVSFFFLSIVRIKNYWKTVFLVLSCQGLELHLGHSLKSRRLTSFRIFLLLTSMCYLNEHPQRLRAIQSWLLSPHRVPRKESFLGQARRQGWDMRVEAKCSEPHYHHRLCLLAGNVLFIFPGAGMNDSLLLLHDFPKVEWWTLRRPTIHLTSVSPIF